MAGESAREIARQRRDKATRLLEVADAYEKGAEGERRTAAALAMLPASGWFVLHDVRWPGRRFANIDHVVIGPGGVFVIDSKAWSGLVTVRDGILRQNGSRRDAAVTGAAEAASAVAACIPGVGADLVMPVLCFSGPSELAGRAGGVMLTTPHHLVATLLSQPAVLDGKAVRRTLLTLQQALQAAQSAPAPQRTQRARATSTTRSRSTDARPRRPQKKRPWLRLLGGALLLLAGLAALRGTSHWGTHPTSPPHHRLGESERAPATARRPPLRIRAVSAGTVHRIGRQPLRLPGERFVGVRVVIHNTGAKPWVSQRGTTYAVTDSLGITHAAFYVPRIREGRSLDDDALRVPAGGTVEGYVTFQVDSSTPITAFSMTVGPGKAHTLVWAIARQ